MLEILLRLPESKFNFDVFILKLNYENKFY